MGISDTRGMDEDLTGALAQFGGSDGAHALRRALCELPLDGATALAIAERLEALAEG